MTIEQELELRKQAADIDGQIEVLQIRKKKIIDEIEGKS